MIKVVIVNVYVRRLHHLLKNVHQMAFLQNGDQINFVVILNSKIFNISLFLKKLKIIKIKRSSVKIIKFTHNVDLNVKKHALTLVITKIRHVQMIHVSKVVFVRMAWY